MTTVPVFDPDARYTASAAADVLGLVPDAVEAWLVARGYGQREIAGAELERLWKQAPPRVRFSGAPLRTRAELSAYAGDNETRKQEVLRVITLLQQHGLSTLDDLWTIDADAARAWAARSRQAWRETGKRDDRQELRIIRPLLLALAQARRREPPTWLEQLLPRLATMARTDPARWNGHRWRPDIEAALLMLRGTDEGVAKRRGHLLELAHHLARNADECASLGQALADRDAMVAAFNEIQARSRAAHGNWSSSTEKHLLEAIRPVLLAGADGGGLGGPSVAPLARLLRCEVPYHASQVPGLVRSYREWARCELRRKGVKPDPKKTVRPPDPEPVHKLLAKLAERIKRALCDHEARGLTLGDFRRWQEWSNELRDVVGAGLAAHMLIAGGQRGGSLHAQQPAYMSADGSHGGAICADRVIVKRVAHEGPDGITTSHDNRPYDVKLAPDIESSRWIVLPMTDFPYALRDLLEWYLHSCGQCLGTANGCASSAERVLRWIELSEDRGRWLYREASQDHVPARTTLVSKDGEWLACLHARPGQVVRFNPLWWSRDGSRIVLKDGLADRLEESFGAGIHRYRHYALLYLTAVNPLTIDEAARLIHMDPITAAKIYNNPSAKQIVSRMLARMEKSAPDERERELAALRRENSFFKTRLKELEHQLAYAQVLYGDIPLPPDVPPTILRPVDAAARPPRRRRASPRGGDAFAA